jgi:hypothetical protein
MRRCKQRSEENVLGPMGVHGWNGVRRQTV